MKQTAVIFSALLLFGACAPDATEELPGPVDPGRMLASLEEARNRWASEAPADYTVTETCPGCSDQTVAVRGDEVVSLTDEDHLTIDDVFTQIEEAIAEGATVQVTYDTELGYPTSVTIDYDGDGVPEVDIRYADLEAMPIVTTREQLLAAKARWEALGLDDYQYIFRADCTCTEEGTWQVTVIDRVVTEELPLDAAARESRQISPGSLDAAFRDLEDWFTNSSDLIEEGFLEVEVRMDPELGYPRWFRIVGAGIEDEGPFTERFEIVVTTDLIGPIEPPASTIDQPDLAALVSARSAWEATSLPDYRFEIEFHCECPESARGPFEVLVRDGVVVSSVPIGGGPSIDSTYAPDLTIDDVLDLIERSIQAGTDVEVSYDGVTGQPLEVIVDPEAVAVDGGQFFTLTPVTVLGPVGFLDLTALAGPQCPVQQSPPDPGCADAPVVDAHIVLTRTGASSRIELITDAAGRVSVELEPGIWTITPLDVEGLLGTAPPVDVLIQPGRLAEILVTYDTGIR